MRRRNVVFVAAAVLLAVMTGMSWRWASSFVRKSHPAFIAKPPLTTSVTQLPLAFELNQGQFDPRVLYAAHTSVGTLFFTRGGLTLALPQFAQQPSRFPDPRERLRKHPALQSVTALGLAFDGANPTPHVEASDQQPGIKNYLIGRDPEKWHTHVPIFGKVAYRNLYPGIDLVFYGGKSGLLEYDLNVSPGADPDQIRFRFEGADRVELDDGELLIQAGPAELRQPPPHVYAATLPRREVPVSYRIDPQGWIGLDVSQRDARDGLRIDPVLAYSTYLGGSGAGDWAFSMAVDLAGSVYVTGFATSMDFPTTPGALQAKDLMGGTPAPDIGTSTVTKLDPSGSALAYSTYIGGRGVDGGIGDEAGQIVVTDAGFAYVVGSTEAPDFPVTDGGAQTTLGGGAADGYMLELGPDGDRLVYATFVGGSDLDALSGLDVDSDGNAYAAGFCNGSHFPTLNALEPVFGGGAQNAIFVKLNADGSQFIYKSYFGGSGSGAYGEQILGIKVDASNNVVLAGYTVSSDVPGHEMSPIPFHEGGGGDIFLTRLGPDGKTQQLFTYLGGNGLDYPWDLRLDLLGNAWLVGQTGSDDFPVTDGGFQTSLASPPTNDGFGPFDAFITVVEPDGGLLYSTYLGGNGDDRAYGIALDAQGHAHVTGYTSSTDLMPKDALHGEHDEPLPDHSLDGGDFLLADFTLDGGLDFLSYLGGSGPEGVYYPGGGLIAVDGQGANYFVGTTASDDYPVTRHAFQQRNNAPAGATNMVVVKFTPTPLPSTLTAVLPISGSFMGHDVDAAGTNMSAQCELDFGGVPSLIQTPGPHQLQVVVGPHACGAVDVTLICPGSPISVLPQGFTFTGCDGGVDEGSSDAGPRPAPTYGCGCGSSGASGFESLLLCGALFTLVRRRRSRQGQTLRRT